MRHIFEASNNADSKSNGIWPDGIYEYKEWIDHKEDWFNENSQYGSFGNFVYYVDGRVGMGIHSGRANKGGWKHPTNGCIRTTDAGTSCLFDIVKAVGYLPFLYIH